MAAVVTVIVGPNVVGDGVDGGGGGGGVAVVLSNRQIDVSPPEARPVATVLNRRMPNMM